MTLRLAHSRHDLPPSWDGVPVEWAAWSRERTTIAYHAPAEALACAKCGAVDESMHAAGKRPAPEGATFRIERTKKVRSGRSYGVVVEVPAWPVYDLRAARCRHCGHDTVWDTRTDEHWDLDEEDYGPDGSRPEGVLW